jgi:peptidoglycan/xylan/chitin deacetylase (PgdA/CDA1 family)
MVRRVLFGVGLAAFVLPFFGLADPTSRSGVATALLALAVALGVAASTAWWRRNRPSAGLVGGPIVAACAWLFSQAPAGAINWVLAALLGLGVGVSWAGSVRDSVALTSALLAASAAGVAAVHWGTSASWVVGASTGAALLGAAVLARRTSSSAERTGWLVPSVGALAVILVGSWIGANSPTAGWFGATVAHGPRNRPEVSLTFDDGPNATATLAIASILDAHGAKGTFFSVGKAVAARPDITRQLISDGQLIGNHSYHHDEWRWLDPRYPEFTRAQRTISRGTGVCPAFYRPPHGQHTPFVAWAVHRAGATMVGWDVSAGDWATHDPRVIADRVLSKVRPGSIIDLHDGLDGKVDVDRTVLVRALPLILTGLDAKHLQPVRLDQLLGRPGYTDRC